MTMSEMIFLEKNNVDSRVLLELHSTISWFYLTSLHAAFLLELAATAVFLVATGVAEVTAFCDD